MNNKEGFDNETLMALWLSALFIGGTVQAHHLGTFEKEGFGWGLLGCFLGAGLFMVGTVLLAVFFVSFKQYIEKSDFPEAIRLIALTGFATFLALCVVTFIRANL